MKQKCIFWGAGNIGLTAYKQYKKLGLTSTIAAFTDANPAKIGSIFCGLPVISLDEAIEKNIHIVITQQNYVQAVQTLKNRNMQDFSVFDLSQLVKMSLIPIRKYLHRNQIILSNSDFEMFMKRYEGAFTDAFIEAVSSAKTYVDIGAEYGYYALLAASLMPEDAVLYLFEPEPFRIEYLDRLFKNDARVRIINKAVSNSNGLATLFSVAKSSTCNNSGVGTHGAAFTFDKNLSHDTMRAQLALDGTEIVKIECETVVLDEVLQDISIDIVKMDIEGAEVLALEGMKNILSRQEAILFLEFHEDYIKSIRVDGIERIADILRHSGYTDEFGAVEVSGRKVLRKG